eukprot:g3755.t1
MPKTKKISKAAPRHSPLGAQIAADVQAATQVKAPKVKSVSFQVKKARGEDEEFLPAAMSRKVLKQAREQQREIAREEREREAKMKKKQEKLLLSSNPDEGYDSDADLQVGAGLTMDDGGYVDCDADDLTDADRKILESFMSTDAAPRRTLADIIMEKIQEKEARQMGIDNDEDTEMMMPKVNPKVEQVYRKVGHLLKTYKSGKLPKAFKIIPSLNNWEEVLLLTNPDDWSAQAMWRATRIFASNFNKRMAQRFFNLVLLPRVRNDIFEHKKLNFHLYVSLKKAMYKPAAFFKGILLPICEGRDCTLKEASILSSVLATKTIPLMHSCAALMKIAQMSYSGTNSIFIRVLLNKKYALPYKVVDAVVDHFLSFTKETRQMPVVWHHSLLIFAQRYRTSLTRAQKEQMRVLLKKQHHHIMTDQIRRELFAGICRGEKKEKKSNSTSNLGLDMEVC